MGDVWNTERSEIKDPNKASDDSYDPAYLKKMVQDYEDLAEKLPFRYRVRAWETVAYCRARFGEKEGARALYERILRENPNCENNAEIRTKLALLRQHSGDKSTSSIGPVSRMQARDEHDRRCVK